MDILPLYTVAETGRLIGAGKTRVYQLAMSGALDARKAGNKTLITGGSIQAYVAGLPKAPLGRNTTATVQ